MVIKIGASPENDGLYNKFIAPCGDGQRGRIVALHKNKEEAIILALNSNVKNDVCVGSLYLIKEYNSEHYPIVVKKVNCVPNFEEWEIVV